MTDRIDKLMREVMEFERTRYADDDMVAEAFQGLFDRAQSFDLATATVNPYSTLPILLDLSHWNGTNHNWAALKGRIIGVIHKLGEVDDAADTGDRWNDSAFQANFGGSASAGIPSLAYFFDDGGAYALNHNWAMDESKWTPIWNDPKLRVIIRQLAYNPQWVDDPTIDGGKRLVVNGWRPFRGIVIDVERHWQSYAEYAKFNKGEITSYRKLSGQWINFSARLLIDRLEYMMNRGMMKRVPVMLYTRKSFIDQYSPDLATTLANRKELLKWPAHYIVGAGKVYTTIEEIRSLYVPPATWKHYEIYGPSTFLQWSGDRYRIPEIDNSSSAVDLNFFMGTAEMFAEIFGEIADPQPDPDPEPPTPPAGDYVTRAEFDALSDRLEDAIERMDALDAWYNRHTHSTGTPS